MTDKEKFRKEVEKLKSNLIYGACSSQIAMETMCKEEAYNEVLAILDTLQEEPVSVWHDVSEEPKPNMELICVGQYGNPLVLSSNSDSFKSRDISKWAYFNDLLNLSNVQRTVKNRNEPVSEYLEKAEKFIDEHTKYCSNLAHFEESNGNVWDENTPWLTSDQARKAVEIAREEIIEQMMAKAIDGVVTFDYYDSGDKLYGCVAHDSFCYEDLGLKDRDEVKILILKNN